MRACPPIPVAPRPPLTLSALAKPPPATAVVLKSQRYSLFSITENILEPDSTPAQVRATLCAASLVCGPWWDIAQAMLSRHLDFKNTPSMRKCLSSGISGEYPTQKLTARCISPLTLFLGLRSTKGLRALRLEGCDNIPREVKNIDILSCEYHEMCNAILRHG